jgi:hypothetical protein
MDRVLALVSQVMVITGITSLSMELALALVSTEQEPASILDILELVSLFKLLALATAIPGTWHTRST